MSSPTSPLRYVVLTREEPLDEIDRILERVGMTEDELGELGESSLLSESEYTDWRRLDGPRWLTRPDAE
ncbi:MULTISPECIES: hypothetical protein [Corynebacterium]|uniref:hypothetical protein n=1 Tax=Corynebacterium TaxID=1716 RepID=UPI00254EC2F2|nr:MULTISPECIES: hypothetical protein [Corynebacterium]MDK6259661.1 hypothetical protein [Corynebacterium frankenforstense]MDK8894905.1 hypothetical protein [Corynebacterium sp. MSK006]